MNFREVNTLRLWPALIIFFTYVFPLFDSSFYYGLLILFSLAFYIPFYFESSARFAAGYGFRLFSFSFLTVWSISLISLSASILFSERSILEGDLLEFIKAPYFFLTFLLFYRLQRSGGIDFDRVLIFSGILILLLSIASFNDSRVAGFYTSRYLISIGRASAPFINPYTLGFVLSFFILYFLGMLVRSRSIFPLVLFVGCVSVLLLTQSRSILLGSIFSLFSFFIICLPRLRFGMRAILFGVSVFLVIGAVLFWALNFFQLHYLVNFFRQVELGEGGEVGSISVRASQIFEVWEFISDSALKVLFGIGPAKGEMRLLESSIAFVLLRVGLVGAIVYCFLFLVLILSSLRLRALTGGYWRFSAVASFFISYPVLGLSSMHIEHPKSSFFFYSLCGMLLGLSDSLPGKHYLDRPSSAAGRGMGAHSLQLGAS